jgi:hypothetical protein
VTALAFLIALKYQLLFEIMATTESIYGSFRAVRAQNESGIE